LELSMAGEAERYNFIREKAGLSKKDFAESLGLSLSMNYQISSGRVPPPRELLERLSSLYGVNLHWFLTGKGESGLDADIAEIELYEQEAAAGYGREIENYQEKSIFKVPCSLIRPHHPKNLKAVYVSGDSMVDEQINDGDIVIFNINQREGNSICVVSVNNSLFVKRVIYDIPNNIVTLKSANKSYGPKQFSEYEINEINIIGRVIACWHKL